MLGQFLAKLPVIFAATSTRECAGLRDSESLRLSSDFLCDTRYTIHARSNHVYRLHFCSGDRYMRHAMYLSCSYFFYSISASDTSFWIDDTLFLKIAAGILHFTHIVDTSRFSDYKSDFCEIFPIDRMFPHTIFFARDARTRRVKMRKYADLDQICELWLSIMEIANVDINFISRTRRVHAPRQKFKNP